MNPGESWRPPSNNLSVLGGISRDVSPRPGLGGLGMTTPNLAAAVAQKRAEAAKEGRDTKSTLLAPRGSSPTDNNATPRGILSDDPKKEHQQLQPKASAPCAPKVCFSNDNHLMQAVYIITVFLL